MFRPGQVGESTSVGRGGREAGALEATFYAWRGTRAGLPPSEMKCLRRLKDEDEHGGYNEKRSHCVIGEKYSIERGAAVWVR